MIIKFYRLHFVKLALQIRFELIRTNSNGLKLVQHFISYPLKFGLSQPWWDCKSGKKTKNRVIKFGGSDLVNITFELNGTHSNWLDEKILQAEQTESFILKNYNKRSLSGTHRWSKLFN